MFKRIGGAVPLLSLYIFTEWTEVTLQSLVSSWRYIESGRSPDKLLCPFCVEWRAITVNSPWCTLPIVWNFPPSQGFSNWRRPWVSVGNSVERLPGGSGGLFAPITRISLGRGISVYKTLRNCTFSLYHSVSTSYVDNVSYPRNLRLKRIRRTLRLTTVASSSGGYNRFGVFIFSWLQPFRCLHLQLATAVSVSSSLDGYSRFGGFIFRWLQLFRCLHLQLATAVSVASSLDGYSRSGVFIFSWLQPFRCLHL